MLRNGALLNGRLLEVLARAGHTDVIVIADAGLPIPPHVELIDLSLRPGMPPLLDVFDAISRTLVYEKAIVAEEADGSGIVNDLRKRLDGIPVEQVPHERFKQISSGALAIVRTGEFTSYGNVALVSGVPF